MVALQQVGSANCLDLGRLAGIPRTSFYQVVDELDSKGLASRLPGNGPAVRASIGRREVLDRLIELEGERLDNLKTRARRVSETLDRLLPTDRSVSLPYVQVIHDPSRVGPLYHQLRDRGGGRRPGRELPSTARHVPGRRPAGGRLSRTPTACSKWATLACA